MASLRLINDALKEEIRSGSRIFALELEFAMKYERCLALRAGPGREIDGGELVRRRWKRRWMRR